jgi:hypothetical protein
MGTPPFLTEYPRSRPLELPTRAKPCGGYALSMTDEHRKNPVDAHREGLEQLERAPHHPTTKHDKPPHEPEVRPIVEPPNIEHRAGPLPYQKR